MNRTIAVIKMRFLIGTLIRQIEGKLSIEFENNASIDWAS